MEIRWPICIRTNIYQRVKYKFDPESDDPRLVNGQTKPFGIYKILSTLGIPESKLVKPLCYFQRIKITSLLVKDEEL